MREIKFRGKRLKNGKWVIGWYFPYQNLHFILPLEAKDSKHSYLFDFAVEVDPATVGQYTGLNDKKGTEIYEGDIIKHHDDITSEVFYNSNRCTFLLKDITGNRNKCQVDRLGDYSCLWVEVIGNIHEKGDK